MRHNLNLEIGGYKNGATSAVQFIKTSIYFFGQSAVVGMFQGGGPASHHGRDLNEPSGGFPINMNEASNSEFWHEGGPNPFHGSKKGYIEFRMRNKDGLGGYQAVYEESTGKLITHNHFRGTRDFISPIIGMVAALIWDRRVILLWM